MTTTKLVVVVVVVAALLAGQSDCYVQTLDFSQLQLSVSESSNNFLVPQMRVLVADFLALLNDYPVFTQLNATSSDIESWLVSHTSFLSAHQLARVPDDWAPDKPVPCVVNPVFHRQLLHSDGESGRIFVPLPVPTADGSEPRLYGFAELEGAGVQSPTDDEALLRAGYLPLDAGLLAFAKSQLLERRLADYYPADYAGPRFGTVGYYAVTVPHCLVRASHFGGRRPAARADEQLPAEFRHDGDLVALSVLVKQAAPVVRRRHADLALRHVLAQLGLSLAAPTVDMYVDGYHYGDYASLQLGETTTTAAAADNAFSACVAATALDADNQVGGQAAVEHCLREFDLPAGLVRATAPLRPLHLDEDELRARAWLTAQNSTFGWIKAHRLKISQELLRQRSTAVEQKSQSTRTDELILQMKAAPNFAPLPEDQPIREHIVSFLASILADQVNRQRDV